MNLKQQFDQLFSQQHINIATIKGPSPIGAGVWEAETEAGAKVLLKGTSELNKKVFYDMNTNRILNEAPNIDFIDVGV